MEAIAKRSQVSKDTLYRWWRSKSEVVLEALASYGDQVIPVADTGSLQIDLRRFMHATSRAIDQPTGQLLRVLAAGAANDATFAAMVRDQFLAHRRAALSTVFNGAVSRGELTRKRAAAMLDLVFGSLWYRLIFDIGPLDGEWADGVVDAVTTVAGR